MRIFSGVFILVLVLAGTSCKEELPVQKKESGFLSLSVSAITIEAKATSGRTKAVSTDNFIVKIYEVGESDPVLTFDPWSSAPSTIELETGTYYAEAQNLDPPLSAAFEQPWYYGKSAEFTIDKEEVKTITIDCTLANFKVSFVYSANVLEDFTDWNSTVSFIDEDEYLEWAKDDDREGYFITAPVSIQVHLSYTKVFTGEEIARDFAATISNPQPATHYRIKVDASLKNGEILLNIGVDEDFETIDIEMGDAGDEDPNSNWIAGDDWTDARDDQKYETVQIGSQVWMAENLNYNTGIGSWWYNNDPLLGALYGRMYTWEASMSGGAASDAVPSGVQGVCPNGWHLPSSPEWYILINGLGGATEAGGKLKETGTANWYAPNVGATNESGFNALPGGWYPQLPGYGFLNLGDVGVFHTSSSLSSGSTMVILNKSSGGVGVQSPNNNAVSVRCIKD
jgi:uncharacterized protein (TIGR02145 family)